MPNAKPHIRHERDYPAWLFALPGCLGALPWYVLWRLKQLSTNPEPEPQDMDEWDRGYQRAMSEIRLNLGLEKWS